MGWYFGFKLHLICNEKGELLNFKLTAANVDDRDECVLNDLTKSLFGKLYADKGYISQKLFDNLFNDGIQLVTNLKSNMKTSWSTSMTNSCFERDPSSKPLTMY